MFRVGLDSIMFLKKFFSNSFLLSIDIRAIKVNIKVPIFSCPFEIRKGCPYSVLFLAREWKKTPFFVAAMSIRYFVHDISRSAENFRRRQTNSATSRSNFSSL
jgi:hypothetical protein